MAPALTTATPALRNLLGGKGANLAEMASIDLPVPPGFTITTEVCTAYYDNNETYPAELKSQVDTALARIEAAVGRKFGDKEKPLLVSVRSGARVSMPGMMDTVLNLGLNDITVRASPTAPATPASPGIPTAASSRCTAPWCSASTITASRKSSSRPSWMPSVIEDTALTPQDWQQVVEGYKAMVAEEIGKPFPQDPQEQLWGAIGAVFGSWMNPRANTYRRLHDIPGELGHGR